MPSLTHQRCFNHARREAVGRCPECARFYCRECVTEHDDRLLCASCLKKLAPRPLTESRLFLATLRACQCVLSLLAAWTFFYYVGQVLLRIPSSFHEGTIWKSPGLFE